MVTAKKQTQGFRTVVHKSMGGITTAISIIYTVNAITQLQSRDIVHGLRLKHCDSNPGHQVTICNHFDNHVIILVIFFSQKLRNSLGPATLM